MPKFADRIQAMEAPATIIRNLFGAMTNPDMISFGGGAPAKEALPVEEVREIAADVLSRDKRGVEALQYGHPMGVLDLREAVVRELLEPKGVSVTAADVIIVNGGLETMNLMCQLYVNPGDTILVESPTFVHCVEIFSMFEANCVPCRMDDEGLIIEEVEENIKKYKPKMVYTVPTFQNPTGKTLPTERRRQLAELGSKYDVIILEDDPYRDIRYSGEALPPIKTFDKTGHTVMACSFSKIFSPGSRLGYAVASPEIISRLFDAHTATNSHSGMISQVLAAEFFNRGYFKGHLEKICAIYRERRDVMMACFDEYFPAAAKHTYPDGGLFTWAELPEQINTTALLPEAENNHGVSYVAGEGFFVEGGGMGYNAMRMSFCAVEPERIRIGMKRLGDLIKSKL